MYKFKLETSAEPKVVGIKDGLDQIRLSNENLNDAKFKKFLYNFDDSTQELKEKDILSYNSEIKFELRRQAKLTDCLNFSPFLHIVGIYSERFIELLTNFKLHEKIAIKEVFIFREGSKINQRYFLIQQPIVNEYIDWEQTYFYKPLERYINKNELCIKFSNNEKYLENLTSINICSINFKDNKTPTYDFISCLSYDFISDNLAKAIKKANFSNVVLKDLSQIPCSEIILHD